MKSQDKNVLQSTHKGNFKIEFGYDVECHVLNDKNKTAVITKTGMGRVLGLSEGGAKFGRTLSSKTISPYLSQNVRDEIDNPIKFIGFGGEHHGYDVTLLIDVCNAYLRAEKDGVIKNDHPAVKQSHIILSASAKSGIKGLVYALTNYNPTAQEVIDAYKLYVQEEAKEYASIFPNELYEAWYRVYQIPKPEKNKPWKFMHLTIKHVYEPLANSDSNLLKLLREYKSSDKKGKSNRLHQYLSKVGEIALAKHIGKLSYIAKESKTQEEYEAKFKKEFPSNQPELFSEEAAQTNYDIPDVSERLQNNTDSFSNREYQQFLEEKIKGLTALLDQKPELLSVFKRLKDR
jgi:hypothetical protein